MSIRDQYDSKTPKQRKTIRIIGVFLALVLVAIIVHACSGPAQAQTYNSLLNPVYACKVVQPDGKVMANILLPGRPEPGDTFSVFGGVREADGVSVNWSVCLLGLHLLAALGFLCLGQLSLGTILGHVGHIQTPN